LPLFPSVAKAGLVEHVFIAEDNEENEGKMMHPVFEKADMKLLDVPVGLLVNFHELTFPGANT
jgi:hypothetical protein